MSGEGRQPGLRRWTLAIEPPPNLAAQLVELIGEPIGIVAATGDGATPVLVYANPGFARLIGRAADAVVGQTVHVLASAVTEPLDLARMIDAIERQRVIDLALQITGAGGRRLWIEVEGRPLVGDGRPYLLHLRDVTAQRAATATAQRLERRFDALANLTSDGVYHLRIEPDCRLVLDWTAGAFERLTGYGAADLEALGGWSALVEPADLRIVQRRAQKLLTGEPASVEYRIKSRDGARHWLRDTGWPQWDDAHELVVGILCAAEDITERRELEEQLLAHQLDRKALIGLTGGLVCELDGEAGLRSATGHASGELARRLQSGVGRRLQDLVGLDLAETWRRQIERIVPGWAPVTFTCTYSAGSEDESYEIRLSGSAGGATLVLVRLASPAASTDALAELESGRDARLRALLRSAALRCGRALAWP